MSELFRTITSEDWRRQLASARRRRTPEAVRERLSASAVICPLCGRRAQRVRIEAAGTQAWHDGGLSCWLPRAAGGAR